MTALDTVARVMILTVKAVKQVIEKNSHSLKFIYMTGPNLGPR